MKADERWARVALCPHGPAAKLVLSYVLEHLRGGCYDEGVAKVVEGTGLPKRTVERALSVLDPGDLEITTRRPLPSYISPANRGIYSATHGGFRRGFNPPHSADSTRHPRRIGKIGNPSIQAENRKIAPLSTTQPRKRESPDIARIRQAAENDRRDRGVNVIPLQRPAG